MSNKRKLEEEEVDAAPAPAAKKSRTEEDKKEDKQYLSSVVPVSLPVALPPPPAYHEAVNCKYFGSFFTIYPTGKASIPIWQGMTREVHDKKDSCLTVLISEYINELQRVCAIPYQSIIAVVKPYCSDIDAHSCKLFDLSDAQARRLVLELHALSNKSCPGAQIGGLFNIFCLAGNHVETFTVDIRDFGRGAEWKVLQKTHNRL